MSIREEIEIQYKQSIRDKKIIITNTIKLIKSAIKDKDIAARSSGNKTGITDQQIMSLFQNLVKQRKDSIESFKLGDRKDLIEKEQKEIVIINSFLPKQKNETETINLIDQLIKDHNLKSIKDMRKIMDLLKTHYSGSIDMALAGKIAKTKLTN